MDNPLYSGWPPTLWMASYTMDNNTKNTLYISWTMSIAVKPRPRLRESSAMIWHVCRHVCVGMCVVCVQVCVWRVCVGVCRYVCGVCRCVYRYMCVVCVGVCVGVCVVCMCVDMSMEET